MAPAEPSVPAAGLGQASVQLTVEVALSPGPREMRLVALSLPAGATVAGALRASGLFEAAGIDLSTLHVGIWGRKATLDAVLREGDRIECYRALKVDPKEARRVRYRAHGEKLPKGVHRPRVRAVDMSLEQGQVPADPAD